MKTKTVQPCPEDQTMASEGPNEGTAMSGVEDKVEQRAKRLLELGVALRSLSDATAECADELKALQQLCVIAMTDGTYEPMLSRVKELEFERGLDGMLGLGRLMNDVLSGQTRFHNYHSKPSSI